jgi:hypothetical protein
MDGWMDECGIGQFFSLSLFTHIHTHAHTRASLNHKTRNKTTNTYTHTYTKHTHPTPGKSLLLRALAGGKAVDPQRLRGAISFQVICFYMYIYIYRHIIYIHIEHHPSRTHTQTPHTTNTAATANRAAHSRSGTRRPGNPAPSIYRASSPPPPSPSSRWARMSTPCPLLRGAAGTGRSGWRRHGGRGGSMRWPRGCGTVRC